MITSLVLEDLHVIGLDSKGRFDLDGTLVSTKEVPFIRYRFKDYGTDKVEYITKMFSKFRHSIHLAEVVLDADCLTTVGALNETFGNLAVYVYLGIDDMNVSNYSLNEHQEELLRGIADSDVIIDRIMLKDNSNSLFAVAANKLKSQASKLSGHEYDTIGICDSPLSFMDGNACITALKARELASLYADNDDYALSSANHECMNCCGCIRYKKLDGELKAPLEKVRQIKSKEIKEDGSIKKAQPKKSKGIAQLVW